MKIEELEKSLERTKSLFPNRRLLIVINKEDLKEDPTLLDRLKEQNIDHLTTEKYQTKICIMESYDRINKIK